MNWKFWVGDWKTSVGVGVDAVLIILTVFFVLMTALDLIGASAVTGFSAQVVLGSAIGLSLLLPARFIHGVWTRAPHKMF